MKTDITLTLGDGIRVSGPALVRAGLALHRTLRYDADTMAYKPGREWSITHIASSKIVVGNLPAMHPVNAPYFGRRVLRKLLTCGDWTQDQPDEATIAAARIVVGTCLPKMRKARSTRLNYQWQRRNRYQGPRRADHARIREYKDCLKTARFMFTDLQEIPGCALSLMGYWDRRIGAWKRSRLPTERFGVRVDRLMRG